jgi:hypothetical protein
MVLAVMALPVMVLSIMTVIDSTSHPAKTASR